MLRKQEFFEQIVSEKIQYFGRERDDPFLLGEFRVLLFKICSLQESFLVVFAFVPCENTLTLGIVCA